MLKDTIRLRGYIKATVYRADGTSFVHLDEKNTISSEILTALALDMITGGANTFGTRSGSLVPDNSTMPNGEDGIAIKSASGDAAPNVWYGMITTTATPASDTVKFTGTFIGQAVTIDGTSKVKLGRDWLTSDFVVLYAIPTSWSSLTLTALDTLKIEWTIEFK